jgi:hypothetical protein
MAKVVKVTTNHNGGIVEVVREYTNSDTADRAAKALNLVYASYSNVVYLSTEEIVAVN